uniref:Putative iron-sulfur cluster-binding domain contining protein n=1 Tax=viral metagenome TaxID=1070528 RepID=A0A6M3K0V6_9ZZZZ
MEPSTRCNLWCPLCLKGAGLLGADRWDKVMPLEKFAALWKEVGRGCKTAVLVGQGEPFLNPDLCDMIALCGGAYTTVDTNGNVPLDYAAVVKSGLREIRFSVDGLTQEQYERYRVGGNWRLAMENMSRLAIFRRAVGALIPRIVWKAVAFAHTERDILDWGRLARTFGADVFSSLPASTIPKFGKEKWDIFRPKGEDWQRIEKIDFKKGRVYPTVDRKHCPVPLDNVYISVNGDVAPCCAIDPDDLNFGNVFETPFEEIWWDEKYGEFRRMVLEDRHQCDACKACSYPIPEVAA